MNQLVTDRCAEAFLLTGYEGTSIDDLVHATGLLLVALLELAPRDAEVRNVAAGALASFIDQDAATALGARLLERAHIDVNSFPNVWKPSRTP